MLVGAALLFITICISQARALTPQLSQVKPAVFARQTVGHSQDCIHAEGPTPGFPTKPFCSQRGVDPFVQTDICCINVRKMINYCLILYFPWLVCNRIEIAVLHCGSIDHGKKNKISASPEKSHIQGQGVTFKVEIRKKTKQHLSNLTLYPFWFSNKLHDDCNKITNILIHQICS